MKIKKLSSTMIFFAITMIIYVVASVLFCYTTKPKVSKEEFPFSITYEYKGETKTLAGILECEYSGSDTIYGEHNRYWNQEVKYENPENVENPYIVDQNDELQTILTVHENMYAGYFMGDPLYQDYYKEYGIEGIEPRMEYYDYKNDISLNDENKEEILESIGFKIIDFTYAEPIENTFSFSGISYEADNIFIFVAILFVFFLLCLIFVRKEKEYQYSKLDKFGILLNFLVGIFAVPFLTIVCMLYGIVGSDVVLIEQIIYNIPPIAILCLALSVVFRRKGYSKPGFYIQFGGILLFALILVLETFC
ncbi:MAG: hypothetical protein IKW30_07895 [Lachnospiraceae bacterium]|nr:hypothetical protein [Lachnospiraceae bacterium]